MLILLENLFCCPPMQVSCSLFITVHLDDLQGVGQFKVGSQLYPLGTLASRAWNRVRCFELDSMPGCPWNLVHSARDRAVFLQMGCLITIVARGCPPLGVVGTEFSHMTHLTTKEADGKRMHFFLDRTTGTERTCQNWLHLT